MRYVRRLGRLRTRMLSLPLPHLHATISMLALSAECSIRLKQAFYCQCSHSDLGPFYPITFVCVGEIGKCCACRSTVPPASAVEMRRRAIYSHTLFFGHIASTFIICCTLYANNQSSAFIPTAFTCLAVGENGNCLCLAVAYSYFTASTPWCPIRQILHVPVYVQLKLSIYRTSSIPDIKLGVRLVLIVRQTPGSVFVHVIQMMDCNMGRYARYHSIRLASSYSDRC